MIPFNCTGCGRKLRAPDEMAGKSIVCPNCRAQLTIPDPESATLPPPSPSEFATLAPPGDQPPEAPAGPSHVLGYEILGELGRGGMGVVYKARHLKLNRLVALKMILAAGHAGQEELKRFQAEARAVAQIQHPGIVQVFEIGESSGLPYISLEFIPGGSLEKQLARNPLKPRDAAALVEQLAEAMQAAHEHKIIHRDLKPANVLLSPSVKQSASQAVEEKDIPTDRLNDSWTPKITDFGLAKRLDEQGQTQTGSIMGTPSYMAPEQAMGAKNIGPAADVYALGAILYECLTGRPPFRAATAIDTILQVVSDEPIPPRRLTPTTPRDLETIALKSLQKDPRKRYASAQGLANDLRAYLEDRPIAARPVGRLTQALRWVRRNRTVASLLTLAVVALVTGAVVSTVFGIKARLSAREARKNAREAEDNARKASEGETSARETLYASNIMLAYREFQESNIYRARQLLESCPAEMRGWEWDYLDNLLRSELYSLRGHQLIINGLAVASTGERAATTSLDRTTRLWDARTGLQLYTLTPNCYRIFFGLDGKILYGVSSAGLHRWDADTGRVLGPTLPLEGGLAGIDFVDNGKSVALVTSEGQIQFLDPKTGVVVRRCPKKVTLDKGGAVLLQRGQFASFSADGKLMAQGGTDCKVRVWDTATGEQVLDGKGHLMHVGPPIFSPDGKQVFSPGGDGDIRIWDLATKKTVGYLRGHRGWVHAIAFSPDGKRLASASKDMTARVWDLESGTSMRTLSGHISEVWGVAWSPDGTRLFTQGADARVNVYDVAHRTTSSAHVSKFFRDKGLAGYSRATSAEAWTYYGHIGPNLGVALSRDGRYAASGAVVDASNISEVRLWDLPRHQDVRGFPVPPMRRPTPAFSPDGKYLAVGISGVRSEEDGEVRLFEVATGRMVARWDGSPCLLAAPVFSPAGKQLAVAFRSTKGNSQVIVWEVPRGKKVFIKPLPGQLIEPGYLKDGRLVVATTDGTVRVLDGQSGNEEQSWKIETSMLSALAVSSAGTVATGDMSGDSPVICLWDAAKGEEIRKLRGHVGLVTGLAFSPDGSRLVSCASEFNIKVWHTGTGKELLSLRAHKDAPGGVAWGGRRIASVGQDGAMKVWDRGLGRQVPATDGWERLYRDDFQREEIGKSWEPEKGTEWKIRDGVLEGTLKEKTHAETRFYYAQIRLRGVELPRTVEVRFTGSVSEPMIFTGYLSDRRNARGLMPILSGRGVPFNFSGATTMLFNLSSGLRFTPLGIIKPFTMTPRTKYRFRVVRTPDRLWLFIDDQEVVVSDIPPLETPDFIFQGSWSQGAAATVTMDDLEIRAPKRAIQERRLRALAETAFDESGLLQEARRKIQREPKLTDEDRKVALTHLAEMRENAQELLTKSLATSGNRRASKAQHELALAQANRALALHVGDEKRPELMPDGTGLYLTAVGLAQFRTGQAKEAQDTLTRAIDLRRLQAGCAALRQVAGLALVGHERGEEGKAQELRRQMEDLELNAAPQEWAEAKGWMEEVKAKVKTIEDKERDALFKAVRACEESGWIRGDLTRYLAGRTEDVRDVSGRTATADKNDVTFDRATLAKLRALDFAGLEKNRTELRYENVKISRKDDTATVNYTCTARINLWWRTWKSAFTLKKTDAVWKISRVHGYPVRGLHKNRGLIFDAAFWKELDAECDKAEGLDKVRLLLDALRPADALAALRDIELTTAEGWILKARAHRDLGAVAEAISAWLKAEELDPEHPDLHPKLTRAALELSAPTKVVYSVAFGPRGELYTGGQDGMLRKYSAEGKLIKSVKHPEGQILCVAISEDGKVLATSHKKIQIWNPETLKAGRVIEGHPQVVYRIALDRDGGRVISASSDSSARVWDTKTGKKLRELVGHTNEVLGAVFDPEGKMAATASHDKTARLWDLSKSTTLKVLKGHKGELIRAAFSPDGKKLATAANHGEVKIWDVTTGNVIQSLTAGSRLQEVVAWSPDGNWLAAAGVDGKVRLWDAKTWKLRRVLTGGTLRVYSLSFSADSKRIAAGAHEGTVRIWEAP